MEDQKNRLPTKKITPDYRMRSLGLHTMKCQQQRFILTQKILAQKQLSTFQLNWMRNVHINHEQTGKYYLHIFL